MIYKSVVNMKDCDLVCFFLVTCMPTETNRLLSKQSQYTEAHIPPAQSENSSCEQMKSVEQLCRQVEELTVQNAELVLKVQVQFQTCHCLCY